MLHFGTASKTLKSTAFPGNKCANCHSKTTQLHVVSTYFHIYFIPVIPIRKELKISCTSCSYVADPQEVSDDFLDISRNLKAKVRSPIYMYFGILCLSLLIGYCSWQNAGIPNEYIDMVNKPAVNDIYTTHNADVRDGYPYSLWKVVDVNGNSISIVSNVLYYSRPPQKFRPDDGFRKSSFVYHKDSIMALLFSEHITSMQRGLGFGTGFNRSIEMQDPDNASSANNQR